MPQRPRISQLKRTDVNYRTFYEQYQELEREASYIRKPVATFGDLPQLGNRDGEECLVLDTDVKYRWSAAIQGWRPLLGKGYDVPSGSIKRYRDKYIAQGGETEVQMTYRYDVGSKTLDVYINGLLQDCDTDYFEVDEMTFEFVVPLEAGAVVTYVTPYLIGNPVEDQEIRDRLLNLEFNSYHMMLTQYYSGKPVVSQGIVFDGFLNTNLVDYAAGATQRMVYDPLRYIMAPERSVISKFQEVFDAKTMMATATTVWVRGSEATLPIATDYSTILDDGFQNRGYIDETNTTAFHDITKTYFQTDAYGSGGDHYFQGDFMSTTGNADRVTFQTNTYYWGYWRPDESYSGANGNETACYGILAQGNIVSCVGATYMPYVPTWPYAQDSSNWHYRDSVISYHRADGYVGGGYGSDYRNTIWPVSDHGNMRTTSAYVQGSNRSYFLYQASEGSGRYRQQLWYITGRSRNISWTAMGRPSGLPNTMFGSSTTTYGGSTTYIDQVGSTKTQLLLRTGNMIYFLNGSSMVVEKTLDFSNADRKPMLYNANARQFTADSRFLYFPARATRDGRPVYFLEVFTIEDGSFVGEIIVTDTNSGSPGTTAMSYDHYNQKLVLGLWATNYYTMFNGKNFNAYSVNTNYSGLICFDTPATDFYSVQSKPLETNLPVVYYRLQADQTLNSGVIDYYIRFNNDPWKKIALNTAYSWTNPSGATKANVTIRALLRSEIAAAQSPILTGWRLQMRPYLKDALYESTPQVMSLTNVTGGKITATQDVPNETTLTWTIQLDTNNPEIPISDQGYFSIAGGQSNSVTVLRHRMSTNNIIMSPVVRDVSLDLHDVGTARLESILHPQIQDVTNAAMWLTTNGSSEYVDVYLSRDGGSRWVKGTRTEVLQIQGNKTETAYSFDFSGGTEEARNKLKVRFDITGAVEIDQYGVSINPV